MMSRWKMHADRLTYLRLEPSGSEIQTKVVFEGRVGNVIYMFQPNARLGFNIYPSKGTTMTVTDDYLTVALPGPQTQALKMAMRLRGMSIWASQTLIVATPTPTEWPWPSSSPQF